MFGAIGEFFSGGASILSGGITGIIGSAVTNVFDYFEQRRKNKHELALRDRDIEEMDKEYEHRKDITAQKTSADVQKSSYEHDSRAYSSGFKIKSPWLKAPLIFVDFARGMVRIVLTLYLVILTQTLFWEVQGVLQQAGVDGLNAQEALNLYAKVIHLILYMTSTCVLWWFGTRPRSQQRKQD